MMWDSALHATRNRRIGRLLRAIVSAALVAAFVSGITSAQPPDTDRAETEAKTSEQSTRDTTQPKQPPAGSKPVDPPKRSKKTFVPTDRIEAESVVAFPSNI